MRIVSTECIPGYPDSNLPTLLVYRNTDVVRNFMGLQHFGGARITPEGASQGASRGTTWRRALASGAAAAPPGAAYSDEKVANRNVRVRHGATEKGP